MASNQESRRKAGKPGIRVRGGGGGVGVWASGSWGLGSMEAILHHLGPGYKICRVVQDFKPHNHRRRGDNAVAKTPRQAHTSRPSRSAR